MDSNRMEHNQVPPNPPGDATSREGGMACVQYLLDLKKWDRALSELQILLAQEPENARLHYLTGLCHFNLKKNDAAKQALKRTIQLNPRYDRGFWLLSLVASRQHRKREALKHIDTALELDSEDPLYLATRGAYLIDTKHPREALKAAEAALAIDPNHQGANNIRTLALSALGRRAEAREQSVSSLEQDPNNAVTWYFHGLQLMAEGKSEEAKQAYLESLRINPEDKDVQDALLRAISVKHPFFALFWRWQFFLARFPIGVRSLISIGTYFVVRILLSQANENPALAPIAGPATVIFVLLWCYMILARSLLASAIKKGWLK